MKPRSTTRRGERGQVLILGALMMTVLVGFLALVIDLGNAYAQRRLMQNAADAAAIAGTRYLSNNVQSGASDAAVAGIVVTYLTPNGSATYTPNAALAAADGAWYVNISGARIKAVGSGGSAPSFPSATGLEVIAHKQVNTYFANAIGIPSVTVRAGASAMYGNAATVRMTPPAGARVLPLIFSLDTYNESLQNCGGYSGNHITFALGVTSPLSCTGNVGAGGFSWGPIIASSDDDSTMTDLLDPGASLGNTVARVGDPTHKAVGERARDYDSLDRNWQGQDVMVALIATDNSGSQDDDNDNNDKPLAGFVWFHVYRAYGSGDPRTIEGWWVDPRLKPSAPGTQLGTSTALTGPMTVALVR